MKKIETQNLINYLKNWEAKSLQDIKIEYIKVID